MVREKLVELLSFFGDCYIAENRHIVCDTKICDIVDHLIANGVTVQGATDNNVGDKPSPTADTLSANETGWISVKDGLPKLIPCDASTAYSEAVNVLTSGRKVLMAIWDGFDWICDAEFWDAEDEEITHWTPVLLPLPDIPKGEEK